MTAQISPFSVSLLHSACLIVPLLTLAYTPLVYGQDRTTTWQSPQASQESGKENLEPQAAPSGLAGKVVQRTSGTERQVPPAPTPSKTTSGTAAKTTPNAGQATKTEKTNVDETAPTNAESGKLFVKYITPKDKELLPIAKLIEESKGFDEIVKVVNETFKLPKIEVAFDMCGEANAYYSSDEQQILMCYELFQYLYERFGEDDTLSEEELTVKVMNAAVFTFFHELGHAFVDVFKLPITGREEDVVDDLATLIFLEAESEEEEENGEIVSDALQSFWIDAEETLEDADFWGEHAMNLQRGARMLCMAYGSNPEKYSDWVGGEDGLPEERAESCPDEFELMQRAWETLLEPYAL